LLRSKKYNTIKYSRLRNQRMGKNESPMDFFYIPLSIVDAMPLMIGNCRTNPII
jgi:hypothetical protein